MSVRTVTLEVLRQGPEHNQLLSPLTPYLTLCGNHPAETLHLPFEHFRFLRRLRELHYRVDLDAARGGAVEMAADVSAVVASIRSLAVELARAARGADAGITHLRLILSASELALIPFELAVAPASFPGAGQALSLQTASPLCLTREARRVPAATVRWPESPRILVAAASPPGVPPVPLRAHLLALRKALSPWLVTNSPRELARHLHVLPAASVGEIRAACAGGRFTHVHLLAHGKALPESEARSRFGLALHRDGDDAGVDVVSGVRLASALRCHEDDGAAGELSSPVVVTLAACRGGDQGDVVAPGASVAHELHEAGVPFVLASQFPLTMRGSVAMAALTYQRLLRGDDPRVLVHDVRQRLHATATRDHDWASLVAYAALPQDIDAQLARARFQRARKALDAALERHDAYRARPGGEAAAPPQDLQVRALHDAIDRLEAAMPGEGAPRGDQVSAHGMVASACKRVAFLLWPEPFAPAVTDAGPREVGEDERRARSQLERARAHYKRVFDLDATQSWALVQHLSLTQVLDPDDRARRFEEWWTTALTLARDALEGADASRALWAESALVELYVLAAGVPEDRRVAAREPKAHDHLAALLRRIDQSGDARARFEAYSTARQLERYTDWWWRGDAARCALPKALLAELYRYGVPRRWVAQGVAD
ncbi:MAG: CHAT domain-containing protein [Polyangiales bacterium]